MDIIAFHDPKGVNSKLFRKFCAKNISEDPFMLACLSHGEDPNDLDLHRLYASDIFRISKIESRLMLAMKGRSLPESLTDDWLNWKHGLLISQSFTAVLKDPRKIQKKTFLNLISDIEEVQALTLKYVETSIKENRYAKIKTMWRDSFLNILKTLGEYSSSVVLISPFPDGMCAISDHDLYVGYCSEESLIITSDIEFLRQNQIEHEPIDDESIVHSYGTSQSWDFLLHTGETASFEFDD